MDNGLYGEKEHIDRLLTEANLYRMRGNLVEAEAVCRKALSAFPNDSYIHEMLGDVLYVSGKLDEALEEYRIAKDLAPSNPFPETKFAKLVLEVAERERQKAVAMEILEKPQGFTVRKRDPGRSLLFSLLIPGLGQFYNGDWIKALIIWAILIVFMISWVFQPRYPQEIRSIFGLISSTSPIVLVFGSVALLAYIYGLIDAPITAAKSSKNKVLEF